MAAAAASGGLPLLLATSVQPPPLACTAQGSTTKALINRELPQPFDTRCISKDSAMHGILLTDWGLQCQRQLSTGPWLCAIGCKPICD